MAAPEASGTRLRRGPIRRRRSAGGEGSLNTYVNGYVTIFNATGNT